MSGLVATEDTIDVITEAQIAVDRSTAMQTIVGSVFKKEALLEAQRRAEMEKARVDSTSVGDETTGTTRSKGCGSSC